MRDIEILIRRHRRLADMLADGHSLTFTAKENSALFRQTADALERLMRALLRESVVSTERRSNVPNGVDEMNIAESGER